MGSTKGKGRGSPSRASPGNVRTRRGPGSRSAQSGLATRKKHQKAAHTSAKSKVRQIIWHAKGHAAKPSYLWASNGRIRCIITLAWTPDGWQCTNVDHPIMSFLVGWPPGQVVDWLKRARGTNWRHYAISKEELSMKQRHEWLS